MTEALRQRKKRLGELKAQVRLLEDEIRYLTVYPNGDEIRVPEPPEPAKDDR
jgi:hypothetical protein